jgi:hypothetical protein
MIKFHFETLRTIHFSYPTARNKNIVVARNFKGGAKEAPFNFGFWKKIWVKMCNCYCGNILVKCNILRLWSCEKFCLVLAMMEVLQYASELYSRNVMCGKKKLPQRSA